MSTKAAILDLAHLFGQLFLPMWGVALARKLRKRRVGLRIQAAPQDVVLPRKLTGCCLRLKVQGALQNGLTHFDEILQEADGVILSRGNLGIDLPAEKVSYEIFWRPLKGSISRDANPGNEYRYDNQLCFCKTAVFKCNMAGIPAVVTRVVDRKLNSRGYFRLGAESSFPSASGFFYWCKKCEADPSCSVSCPFDDSQFYKVGLTLLFV
ncbi:hypothetical protein DKX38_028669 [Salix brachista]|uniref:Pyruvate kinase barrel domain-containing protein n=1 Tax=Salix brachista TaxID=2182728 RepID=A0A5N5JBA5_9ROSI|nr:hypothetical protein DKX38_028669 [Salix brachista]